MRGHGSSFVFFTFFVRHMSSKYASYLRAYSWMPRLELRARASPRRRRPGAGRAARSASCAGRDPASRTPSPRAPRTSRRSRNARMACVARVRTMGPRSDRVARRAWPATPRRRGRIVVSRRLARIPDGDARPSRCGPRRRAPRATPRRSSAGSSPPPSSPQVSRPCRSSTITVGSSCAATRSYSSMQRFASANPGITYGIHTSPLPKSAAKMSLPSGWSASARMASACVWSTKLAGRNACSSVSTLGVGAAASSRFVRSSLTIASSVIDASARSVAAARGAPRGARRARWSRGPSPSP